MAGQRHLGGAIALEGDRRRRAGQLGKTAGQLESVAVLDHDVGVRVRPPEHAVADVAPDDPGLHAEPGRGSLEKAEELLLGYWLMRAHSTAPTCPARSPRRARRRRGRRAGLMKGDERSVSSIVGCTSAQDRETPPPMTNISGSRMLVRLISAIPM